jgi:hypothetical protein
VIGHPQIAASEDSPGSSLTASRGVLHGMPARMASSVHERARLAAATARRAGYVPRPLDAPGIASEPLITGLGTSPIGRGRCTP